MILEYALQSGHTVFRSFLFFMKIRKEKKKFEKKILIEMLGAIRCKHILLHMLEIMRIVHVVISSLKVSLILLGISFLVNVSKTTY